MLRDAKPRLLDRCRQCLRLRHYCYRAEQQYLGWIRRFILFHNKRHPQDVLNGELPWLDKVVRAKTPLRLPLVLTSAETRAALCQLEGIYWLICSLLYGTGIADGVPASAHTEFVELAVRIPARKATVDPRSGIRRRHHLYEDSVQRQMKLAVRRAGIAKPASCLTHCPGQTSSVHEACRYIGAPGATAAISNNSSAVLL